MKSVGRLPGLATFVVLILVSACHPENNSPADDEYVLPYEVGKSFMLLQGVGGAYSHSGKFHYAFDFEMETGTTITASRPGVVIQVQEGYEDGNRTPGQENFVIVQHGDGSFGRYFHLTRDGALVSSGQIVGRGEPIGLSGDTGYSTQPHLHFDVTQGCALPAPDCQTIPIEFSNCSDKVPVAGESYEAAAY